MNCQLTFPPNPVFRLILLDFSLWQPVFMGLESLWEFWLEALKTHQGASVWSSLVFQIPKLLVLPTMQRHTEKSPPGQFCQDLIPEFAHTLRAWLYVPAILLWEGRRGRDVWSDIYPCVCLPAFLCYSHLHLLSEILSPGVCGSTVPLHSHEQRILYDPINFILEFEGCITHEDCLIQHIDQPNWPSMLLWGFLILLNQGAKCFLCWKNYQEILFQRKCFGSIIPSGD